MTPTRRSTDRTPHDRHHARPRPRRWTRTMPVVAAAAVLAGGQLAVAPSASADVTPTVRVVTDARGDVDERWAPGTPALPVGAADLTRVRLAVDDARVTVKVRVAARSPRERDGQRVEVVLYLGPPNSEAAADLRVTSDGRARAVNYVDGRRCTDVTHASRPGRRLYVVSAPTDCFGEDLLGASHVAVVRASITRDSVNRSGPIRGDVRVIRHLDIPVTAPRG